MIWKVNWWSKTEQIIQQSITKKKKEKIYFRDSLYHILSNIIEYASKQKLKQTIAR